MLHNWRTATKQTDPITRPMDILMPASAELCPACRAPMLPDQRYCLECGERRSDPRRYVAASAPPALPPAAPRRRTATPAGATLVAGVATLLIALGVGVEIGRSSGSSSTPRAAAPVRIVTVGSAGTAAAAPAATATATASPDATPDASATKEKKTAKATPTPKAVKTPPPEVKVGTPGKGPGYKDGKFTGDFFGQ